MIAKTDVDGGKLFVRPIPGIFGGEAETITTEGTAPMRIDIVTLFPEMCETLLGESIIGRALGRAAICRCAATSSGAGARARTSAWTTAPSAAARACC